MNRFCFLIILLKDERCYLFSCRQSNATMSSEPQTLIESYFQLVEKMPDRRFMTQPMGGAGDEENLKYWTFAQVLDEAKRIAAYLESLKLEKGSHIALCSKNCSWWIIADLAIVGFLYTPELYSAPCFTI